MTRLEAFKKLWGRLMDGMKAPELARSYLLWLPDGRAYVGPLGHHRLLDLAPNEYDPADWEDEDD